MLNNLLEWSRSQSGKIPYSPQKTNLFLLVHETYMLLNNSAEAKNIQIEIIMEQNIEVEVDIEMFKTIIRNLLSNAIKFTPENGTIKIAASILEENVEILITDSGVGMDEKTKNSLFKIGETKSLKGTNGEEGTGFGLLLCKEFVEKHNGQIKVESEVVKGSTFILSIPLEV